MTGSYRPSSYEDNTYMRVKDFALRPEYITNTWSVHYNEWLDDPNLRVMCRGVTSMSNTCPSNPCDTKATCVYTSGNETLCLCTSGYTGLRCSVNKQCPTPHPKTNTELNFAYPGKRLGDLGMAFCSGSYPSMRYYLCVDGNYSSYWSGQGSAPWAKPINFDDNPIVVPVVITVAVLVQILRPCVLWNCALCKTAYKEVEEEEDDGWRMDQVGEDLEKCHQRVAAAGSQEELDQGVQEYQQAVQDYQRESEAKELSPRNASLWRLISMDMFFSFYLWLIYFVGCGVSHCTTYGSVFEMLRIFAIVMLCLSPVIVLIESCFSHELDYLENIMEDETAWGYIQRMHEVQPRINMVVKCYHYETRTKVVYYTDARGNRRSRTETETEKVVTFVDQDEFSFGSWVDVSTTLALSTVALTRVKIDSSILFGDQETADDYERQVAEMLERNRQRDVYTDYSWSKEIPGLKKRISAYVDSRVKPFWIRPLFFWLATLLQMTRPYRWLFRAKTAKSHYALKKKMYKSTTPPREVDVMDPIAVLAGNAPSVVSSSGPDNNCLGYPMSVLNNPGTGNPTIQNGGTPNPTVNPYLGQGDPVHAISTPYAPQNPEGGTSLPPYPVVPQANAPSPPYVAGLNNPAPDSTTPNPPVNTHTGPAFQPYSAGPPPSAPPPSCQDAVGSRPQPNNETCPPPV